MFDINDWKLIFISIFIVIGEFKPFKLLNRHHIIIVDNENSRDNFLDFDFGKLLFNVWEIPGTRLPTSLSTEQVSIKTQLKFENSVHYIL